MSRSGATEERAADTASTGISLDRRDFLAGTGTALAVAALPTAALARATQDGPPRELLTDWTIDDVWGLYPRYADAIGFGRVRASEASEEVGDHHLVY